MQRQLPHCLGFADAMTRQQHFQDHSKAITDPIEYERAGIDFMNLSVDAYNHNSHPENVYLTIRSNGDLAAIYWNPEDGDGLFGVMTSNGVLRTFFGITKQKEFTSLFLSKMKKQK